MQYKVIYICSAKPRLNKCVSVNWSLLLNSLLLAECNICVLLGRNVLVKVIHDILLNDNNKVQWTCVVADSSASLNSSSDD